MISSANFPPPGTEVGGGVHMPKMSRNGNRHEVLLMNGNLRHLLVKCENN